MKNLILSLLLLLGACAAEVGDADDSDGDIDSIEQAATAAQNPDQLVSQAVQPTGTFTSWTVYNAYWLRVGAGSTAPGSFTSYAPQSGSFGNLSISSNAHLTPPCVANASGAVCSGVQYDCPSAVGTVSTPTNTHNGNTGAWEPWANWAPFYDVWDFPSAAFLASTDVSGTFSDGKKYLTCRYGHGLAQPNFQIKHK